MNLPSAREPKIANLKITHAQITKLAAAAATGLALLGVFAASLHGQAALLQQRVAELKESTAKNKQALAQYTWVEKVTVYLKGEQKKKESFQVRMGPDGKPQKLLSVPRPLLKMIPAHAAAAASASASWPRRKKNTRTTPSK
ncbi:MAG TPA: hypothetical protein VJ228_12390 [Candidatus Acidoferrales bacterium]|jgi:hypothetical protein|nr:hypothetical protein [Candidatus Acidoferrales bacterium]